MTALTGQTRPGRDAIPRPLPWWRMAWVTWRQHRAALAGVAVFLGAWAAYLWVYGLTVRHAYAAAACHPASPAACGDSIDAFNFTYGDPALTASVVLQTVPALIGAFAGAPVLARELETGTFRYAWTLSFTRWRWALAKLVPLAIAVAAGAVALSVLFSWFFQPFFADGNETPFTPELFDLRGVALAAWTLAAFAIGALAGVLIRRVVPAIVATLAAWAALALATSLYLRQRYLTPLLTSNPNVPGSAWVMSQTWTKDGRFAFAGRPPEGLVLRLCQPSGLSKMPQGTIVQCLARRGYTQWTSYQPVSRFWLFQWIEGGWLLGLSVLLIAITIWLVRRRAA